MTKIGLEIHCQLTKLESKLFCSCKADYREFEPNRNICPICMGIPGSLPLLNKNAVEKATLIAMALDCRTPDKIAFFRKNYFYPDLPKGYQISHLDNPIVEGGVLEITLKDGSKKKIRITRAHLEEDAGKSLHEDFEGLTGIDLNRAGTPLLEIVSEPDLSSPEEAVAYLKKIHSIIRYLEISDGNMAEGSMRCDANVSLRKKGSKELGTRTETKNVNSFKFVEKAIQHEMKRQIKILESGERVTQETRLYDSQLDETRPMRSKEYANDYRYFPEPDLLPVVLTEDFIKSVKDLMPELSEEKEKRFIKEYKLSDYDANVLSVDPNLSNFFEEVVVRSRNPKLAANWIMGELSAFLNKENLSILETKVDSINLGNLLSRIEDSTISGKIAKEIFEEMWNSKKSPDEIIEEKGLKQVTDSSEIEKVINQVLEQNQSQLEQYKSGKVKLFGFFVGQVMKASRGKANPEQVNKLLEERLKE